MARPYDVFLCYVWEDKEQADLLRVARTELGWKCLGADPPETKAAEPVHEWIAGIRAGD